MKHRKLCMSVYFEFALRLDCLYCGKTSVPSSAKSHFRLRFIIGKKRIYTAFLIFKIFKAQELTGFCTTVL
jgi:hypothetical protein